MAFIAVTSVHVPTALICLIFSPKIVPSVKKAYGAEDTKTGGSV